MSFMAVAPFFARIPRYVFAILSEALWVSVQLSSMRWLILGYLFRLIPLAIVGAKSFYATLIDILSEYHQSSSS